MMKRFCFFLLAMLVMSFYGLSASSHTCYKYNIGMAMPHWNHYGYHLKISTEATSDAEPEKKHTYAKTLKAWYNRFYGVVTDGVVCTRNMIGDLKPDQNGIIHVKISIVVGRKGFDASKPEVVYVDVKDKKKMKITGLSAHNWRSSYHKYQNWIIYFLADNDHKK